jgi:hypothetical protein
MPNLIGYRLPVEDGKSHSIYYKEGDEPTVIPEPLEDETAAVTSEAA